MVCRQHNGRLPSAPEDPATLDILGWAQFLSGQERLAEINLRAAWQRDAADPAIHYHLAELYVDQGDQAAAEAQFRQAIKLDSACHGCKTARIGSYAELATRAIAQLKP